MMRRSRGRRHTIAITIIIAIEIIGGVVIVQSGRYHRHRHGTHGWRGQLMTVCGGR
jgi:hypothetical protein